MAKDYFHPDSDFYRKMGVTPPSAVAHATEEEIAKNMRRLKPNSWVLRGNVLEGDTDMGKLVQTIDPAYILTGVDEEGLPTFTKVV